MWAAQYYPYQNERQLVTSGGLGTMGFGVPAAIGAKLPIQIKKLFSLSEMVVSNDQPRIGDLKYL